MRAWKSFKVDSRGQTYVFKSKIALEIQKWVQNNQLSSLPSNDFFKKLIFGTTKLDILLIFEFLCQHICINKTRFEKFNCRSFRISWNINKMLKTVQFFHMFYRYYSYNRLLSPSLSVCISERRSWNIPNIAKSLIK